VSIVSDKANRVPYVDNSGARGYVVSSGTMLQAGRSRVRFPMRSFDFSTRIILPAALMAMGSTQSLT
jgi:hypothetical protein